MRVFLIACLLMATGAKAAMQLSTGIGIEGQTASDVNSQFVSPENLGLLYLSAAFHPWSALWEVGAQPMEQATSTGNYRIGSQKFNTMLWGRFEPWPDWAWSPYVGLGAGQSFIKVHTQFGSASDERWTDGGLAAGLAGGLMASLFNHWNIEGELRILKQEFSNNLNYGLALRTGYTF